MKVLYVVSRPIEINTSASIRNKATIIGLLKNGFEVDLITTEPDKKHNAYDSSMKLEGINTTYIKLGGTQSVARIGRKFAVLQPLKRIVTSYLNKKNVYDNLVGIVKHIDSLELDLGQYEYIVSSSDPKSSHLFVYNLLEKNPDFDRKKWIQIWGDPFVGDIATKNQSNIENIKREEEKLLSGAGKVVYVSKLTLETQKKLYPADSEKMLYFPIPYVEKNICELRNLDEVPVIELAYCGDYGSRVRDIMPLYNAINNTVGYHLTICGLSDLDLESTENVTILPRVEREKVLEIERNADILVHLSNLYGTQIPGKIYQYSGTNKPIMFILDGDKEKLMETFGKYQRYSFALNKEKEIIEQVETIRREKKQYAPVLEFDPIYIVSKIMTINNV